jgi:hypothetical protein
MSMPLSIIITQQSIVAIGKESLIDPCIICVLLKRRSEVLITFHLTLLVRWRSVSIVLDWREMCEETKFEEKKNTLL